MMLHFFHTLLLIPSLILSAAACQSGTGNTESNIAKLDSLVSENYVSDEGYNTAWINSEGTTVKDRFITPDGYQRKAYKAGEFGYFLQHLPLKKMRSEVLYYNGNVKAQNKIYVSVVNLPIGTRDLHQCADAVMRLRADYLYQQKRFKEIHFNFLSDAKPRYYTDYIKGDYSAKKYWKYMEYIFAYANTASLHDELPAVSSVRNIKIGDTFIQKGNPIGHAIIAVDMAENEQGEKLVLLAQSYMPAQEIQILNNPNDPKLSPWYKLKDGVILTPEWKFKSENLKTWKN
ncbi:DUF4846 domain-containing protein [Sphingobacterium spiritivorum]|uniref:DUF4846 domain-containing protein n=1 Tax=Sphingobacterium spiritivorum TaxID=258 RepID=UPI003DA39115